MPFVTKFTFQSGDRTVLDRVVEDIRTLAGRKGIELRGPHSMPPDRVTAERLKRLENGTDTYDPWTYTVYTRKLEIVGADDVAGTIAHRSFPSGVHVEVEVEQIKPVGHRSR